MRIYCKSCTNQYHNNRKEQRNAYERQKRKTDFNYKLNCTIRRRTNKAFKSQNISNKSCCLLGCRLENFKKWILHQLNGEMTEDNYGKIWCSDHFLSLSKTNLSNQNGVKKTTYWIKVRPMFCSESISKGDKLDLRLYLKQEVKAKYILKLNAQEGPN